MYDVDRIHLFVDIMELAELRCAVTELVKD